MTTAAAQSYNWLNELTRKQHRGRGDTWAAARDRAAKLAGIDRSYAKRIWDRWQTMRDVSGEALLRLQAAYEASCEKMENEAAGYRAQREALNAVDTSGALAPIRAGNARSDEVVAKKKDAVNGPV